jgi:hypothetical protein
MKKTPKTKLRIEREVLRTLQAHELRQVDGGGALPESLIVQCPPPPLTQDSVRACCA